MEIEISCKSQLHFLHNDQMKAQVTSRPILQKDKTSLQLMLLEIHHKWQKLLLPK